MSARDIVEPAATADSLALSKGIHEGIERRTFWHLEKREGDYYAFVDDRREEARDVILRGRKPYSALTGRAGGRFADHIIKIQAWLGDPKTNKRAAALWTPDKMIDEALHLLFLDDIDAFETVEAEGNLLVTVGITALLNLLKGDAATAFSNANSYLGVGDSSTAAAVGQTDLQAATNKLRKAMNASYPVDTAPTIDFQSSFGSSEANFAWAEVGTFNAAAAGDMLNRVVQALGTKTSGATWTLTETITWS